MTHTTVTSTEFQTRAGEYLDEAGRKPVYITRTDRSSRVLMDASEYERLKQFDTRRAYRAEDIPDHLHAVFEGGYRGSDDDGAGSTTE